MESLDRFYRDNWAAAHELMNGGVDVRKKLLKTRKSYNEVEVDYNCIDGVIDKLIINTVSTRNARHTTIHRNVFRLHHVVILQKIGHSRLLMYLRNLRQLND